MPVQTVIKFRRDTAANWTSTNPTLAAGEVGLETDSGLVKYGNGTSAWDALAYSSTAAIRTRVLNQTGSAIVKGSVVYINGASGDNPTVTLADADTETTSSKTLGLVDAEIANGAIGYVVEAGLITGLNTATATAGQSVWLSSTAGGFVYGAPPAKPAHSVYLGVVIRAQTNNGAILVKVQNGYELNELHDVNAGSPSTGQVLQWNGTAWVNATLDALPSQSGNNGEYLTTDGTNASWAPLDLANKTIANPTITVPGVTTYNTTNATVDSFGWDSGTRTFTVKIWAGDPTWPFTNGQTIYLLNTTYSSVNVNNINFELLDYVNNGPYNTVTLRPINTADDATVAAYTAAGGTTLSTMTVNRAITLTISSTEISYLDGATSNLQTQLGTKLTATVSSPSTGQVITYNGTAWVNGAAAATGETISSFLLMGA